MESAKLQEAFLLFKTKISTAVKVSEEDRISEGEENKIAKEINVGGYTNSDVDSSDTESLDEDSETSEDPAIYYHEGDQLAPPGWAGGGDESANLTVNEASIVRSIMDDERGMISLSQVRVDHDFAWSLGKALSTNQSVTSIDMDSNYLSDIGSFLITKGLEGAQHIREVSLIYNDIGPYGARGLCRMLTANSTIRRLELHNNSLGEEGAIQIAAGLIARRQFRESRMSITDSKDGKQIGEPLESTLEYLGLYYNRIGRGTIALARALMTNVSLVFLDLSINYLDDLCAEALAKSLRYNRTLRTLVLPMNRIADSGAIAFALALPHNRTLTELDLCGNAIGQKGINALADALEVVTCKISTSGNPGIRESEHLEKRFATAAARQSSKVNFLRKLLSLPKAPMSTVFGTLRDTQLTSLFDALPSLR
ncbi:hypothetical protein AAMO2058_001449300 [Amorphochlora amoebiformis]